MYAVIRTGSKQYRVEPGDIITVEKLNPNKGNVLKFRDVLLVNDGDDLIVEKEKLKKFHVKARVMEQVKGKKILVFKFKPKKGYKRKKGHRQELTKVKIEGIVNGSL
ncbi:MAG: 50S ribosomal protein L21 [Actinomycetota bacterium]|nr:50S ribosomal protein L21 [Actinomycetota bacterium]